MLVDRDDDCVKLQQKLEDMAEHAGLITKTESGAGNHFQVVNRIAIEKLEVWFFGDWSAVVAANPRVPATLALKAPYRNPDAIVGGAWEAFERILKRAGYFSTWLRKLECARAVATHMEPSRNSSGSFRAFYQALAAAMVWG